MAKRALVLAKLIFEAEPDAALGDPETVERVTQALAKVTGAILATTLVRHGEEALEDAVRSIVKVVELEARRTASMVLAIDDDSGDPADTIN
jgi:ABC-type polar amino acid transport system ATPase subunit